MIEELRETAGNILALWIILVIIPVGPWLAKVVASHYALNEIFWAFIGMPLGLSVFIISLGTIVTRANQR